VLQPKLVTDPNGNRTAYGFTPLQQTLGDGVATMQLFVEDQVTTFSAARAEEVEQKLAELDEPRRAQERQLELHLAKSPPMPSEPGAGRAA
jgi:hypothetical protein